MAEGVVQDTGRDAGPSSRSTAAPLPPPPHAPTPTPGSAATAKLATREHQSSPPPRTLDPRAGQ